MTGVWIAEKMGREDIHILGRGCERRESFAGRIPATVLTVDRLYDQLRFVATKSRLGQLGQRQSTCDKSFTKSEFFSAVFLR